MAKKKGRSEERKDTFGDKYVQHYDENGFRAGWSEERTGFLGDKHTQHYDQSGSRTGRSEECSDILGDGYVQHRDQTGAKAGWSEQRAGIFGDRYTNHYERMPPGIGPASGVSGAVRNAAAGAYVSSARSGESGDMRAGASPLAIDAVIPNPVIEI